MNLGVSNDDINSIYFINKDTGFCSGSRIYKTTNGGLSWTVKHNVTSTYLTTLFFINPNLGFCTYSNQILKSSDEGESWHATLTQPNVYFLKRTLFLNTLTGYSVGCIYSNPYYYALIMKTTNGGNTWDVSHTDGYRVTLADIIFFNSTTGFATGEYLLYKTTNSGNNWIRLNTSNPYGRRLVKLDSNTGLMGTNPIYKTFNTGLNWNLLSIADTFNVINMHFVNSLTGYKCGFYANSIFVQAIIKKTTNGGISWFQQSTNGIDEQYRDVFFVDSNTGYLSGNNFGAVILKTTNGGDPVGISQINNEVPLSYYLQQNYPNPFNPQTNIKFDIPNRSNVKISVFDILGKEISVLVNEELNPGTFEVNWDASNYPSGVYFYKIVTEKFSESKKMILIK